MNGMENSDKIEGQLHGIFIDVDLEHITMSMSFYGKNFLIKTNNFMLEMAKASHSSITTKILIFDEKTQKFVSIKTDEYAKDEQIRRQFFQLQHQGAQLADFPGLWAIALDMLPSDFNQKQELKIFTLGSKDTKHLDHKICDINSGKWAENACHIEAYFLGPNDDDDKYPGEAVTGLKTIELPYNETLKNAPLKMGDKIYITGRIGEPKSGTFKIHLLHNWTEPDSIMGETILSIMVRPNRINFASHYNFTVNIKHNDPIDKHIGQSLDQDIDHKFSMVISAHGNGNYSLVLNCLDGNKTFFFVQNEALFPVGYTLTDYILIETEGKWENPDNNPWELHHFKINKLESTLTEPNPPNTLTTISADPSYSLEMDLANLDNDIFIIVKLELPENAIKFDINLVRHDGKRNDGIILAHFHANLIGGYYVLGRCQKTCTEWTNTKTIDASNGAYKQLDTGQEFELVFAQINKATDLIFIDGILLNQWPTLNKPNYIQFKGNVILSNLTIHHNNYLIAQEYPLESAFKPFNEITILVKLEPTYNKFKIIFKCRNEGKCGKALSNNFMELLYSNETAMLIHNDESFSKEIQLPLNEVIEVRIYANQFEYQISIMNEHIFTANYLQFPTPDKIDTIQIDGLFCHVQGKERAQKEWKQGQFFICIDSDISLEFIYKLDKTLEIGSTIKAKIKSHMMVPCGDVNPFKRAKEAKTGFWIQLEFHGNEIQLNLDCVKIVISVDSIPNSPETYLLFEGGITLFKSADKDGGKVIKTINEGTEKDVPKPALIVFDMKGVILIGNNLIYMSGMLKRESQFLIKFLQLENEDAVSKLIAEIMINVDKNGSITPKWLDKDASTSVPKEPPQNNPIADIHFYVLIGRDSNGDFALLINGIQHFIEKSGNFNFVQIYGWIEPIDLPIIMQNSAADYKNFKKFDNMLLKDNIPVNAQINLYLTLVKRHQTADENKIEIILDCICHEKSYYCAGEENPSQSEVQTPTSLYPLALVMDMKNKTISANTFKKSGTDFCEVEEKRDQPFFTNYTLIQPLWLSIKHDPTVPEYKVLINNQNVFSIKSANVPSKAKIMEIAQISMNGFFVLFNKITAFPLGFALKNVKEEKLPENLHITVKGAVMANAEKLHFLLATPDYKGSKNEEKAKNIYRLANGETGQKIGIVHLHVRVNQKENELCIGDHNPTGSCTGIQEQNPFVDGKPFLFEIIGKNENAAYTVQINGKQIGEEYKNLDAMFLAITGDMVLFNSPKCEPECPGQQIKL